MLTDTARFLPTDSDSLVSASLACPVCLQVDGVDWDADVYGHDPVVACRCVGCDVDWRVYLAPHQALRFALMAGSSVRPGYSARGSTAVLGPAGPCRGPRPAEGLVTPSLGWGR